MRTMLTALVLTMALAGPAMAQQSGQGGKSPSATQGSSAQSAQAHRDQIMKTLQNAGFSNIQVLDTSYLVSANTPTGETVVMVINPPAGSAMSGSSAGGTAMSGPGGGGSGSGGSGSGGSGSGGSGSGGSGGQSPQPSR